MRLINTETLELQEFFDSDIPPYAILSHRWEQDEVSYQDLLEGKKKGGAKYKKIRKFCAVALRDHFDWAWVDTCCIDKKSSADLSEAINAIFGWYQRSQMCYVYLSDVMRDWNETEGLPSHWPTFKQSKWFTRGWTLQELIAPRNLIFYDCHWHPIERRHEMLSDITAATGIPSHAFGYLGWSHSSVAQRMSWASQRETSRVEDIAYCLLGLFDVRMPLLYGEGAFAFKRLQEEIIKVSGDETLFVWSAPKKTSHRYLPLLAESPACFADCGEVTTTFDFWRKPYSMTNKGLKLSTSFYSDPHRPGSNYFLTPLNCQLESEDDAMSGENQRKKVSRLALQLEKLVYRDYSFYFRKSWCKMPAEVKEVESTKTIHITNVLD